MIEGPISYSVSSFNFEDIVKQVFIVLIACLTIYLMIYLPCSSCLVLSSTSHLMHQTYYINKYKMLTSS